MNKTVVIFPDTLAMADFIFSRNLSNIEANSREFTVTAYMEQDDIIDAVSDHDGHLNTEWIPISKPKC